MINTKEGIFEIQKGTKYNKINIKNKCKKT